MALGRPKSDYYDEITKWTSSTLLPRFPRLRRTYIVYCTCIIIVFSGLFPHFARLMFSRVQCM